MSEPLKDVPVGTELKIRVPREYTKRSEWPDNIDRKLPIKERIEAALQRIRDGHAYMRIPADETDVDWVLADCLTLLSARTEELPQWRDPKDKPPNIPGEHHSENVLLLMKSRTSMWATEDLRRIGHVSCGHWRPNGGNGNFDEDVEGWMPLPDAPRSPQRRSGAGDSPDEGPGKGDGGAG